MGNKNVKQKPAMSREDIAVYRVMTMIVINVIAVYILWFVKQSSARELSFVLNVLPVLKWVFAGLTLLAFAAILYFGFRDKVSPLKVITLEYIFGVSMVGFFVSILYRTMDSTYLILGILLVSVPYYILYFYPRSFFRYSVYTAVAVILSRCFSPYAFDRYGVIGTVVEYVALAVGVLLAVAVIVLGIVCSKHDGTLTVAGRRLTLFTGKKDYIAFFALSVVLLAEAVLSVLLPIAVPFFFYPIAALFLLFAIIYAIKMI